MAEAMIINQQLDASPDKSKQQFYYSEQPSNNHLVVQQQQLTNANQCDNNNNGFGYLPGYLYSCYPFVMSSSKSSQDLSTWNVTPLNSSQQQPLDGASMQQSQQHQQSVLLHNGVVPSGYISGFYSLVPLQPVVANDVRSCQQGTTSSDHNYHHHHHHHSFPPVDGQGALLGPIVGYPLPYLPQHFQQQRRLQFPQQQFNQHQQFFQLSQQFTSNCSNVMTVDGHKKVIIMKDASIQTEFNERISERMLLDDPNSFYLGGENGFKSPGNDSSESLSKATDTYPLLKGCSLKYSTISCPPFEVRTQDRSYGRMSNYSYRAPNLPLQQLNSINPFLSNFPHHFSNMSIPAPLTTLQRNVSGFCLSTANYNNQMQLAPNLFPISSNLNVFPSATLDTPSISNKQSSRIDVGRRQKFYRKTRTDQGQKVTNPTFEIKKEFSDIVDAVGSLVAKSGSVGNSEPSSSRASSKSTDLGQNTSEEKVTCQNSGTKGYKNVKQSFSGRCSNNVENTRFGKRSTFDACGKMLSFLPAEDVGRVPFNVYNGIDRHHSGVDVMGWTQAAFQKNHDVRSTKRKQQKRQMLANKAAEEEMEEISKERDNLLKEIMSTKGGVPREIEVADGVCKELLEAVGKELVKDDELQSVITCKKDDGAEADTKFLMPFDGDESSAVLEFVEPPETCIPAQQTNPVQKHLQGNNSLEENPSPLSQMSPLTFSPPLSCPNELMDVEGSNGNIVSKIHSRRFREYCSQVLDKEIDDRCVHLLQDLVKFQDRMYHVDPSKAKQKKRFVLGLREVAKHLKMGKLKCVIISPNLEQTQSKGGLDEALKSIIETCQAQEVPFIFALGRRALGRACAKLVPVSVVGIFSYEGVEEDFEALKSLTEKARSAYSDMVNNLKKEAVVQASPADISNLNAQVLDLPADKCDPSSIKSSSSVIVPVTSSIPSGPPQGGFEKLFPHLGHSRTPSACSAISFISSVLSEPISENLPQSEAEIENKNGEMEQSVDKDVTAESRDKEVESKLSQVECHGDNSSQKFIPPQSLLNLRGLTGNDAALNKEVIGCSSALGKMNSDVLERTASEVKHRGSLPILTSIHENCELELPVPKTHSLIAGDSLHAITSDALSTPYVDEEDCHKNWTMSKRFPDRTRKFSGLDSNDGNDADTEEDLKISDGIQWVMPHPSPKLPAPLDGSSSREFSSLTQLSGVVKSCRRRSKEDKSDDDKTIILSKCDEDNLVFPCENPYLERPACRVGSHTGAAFDQVEVLLAQFTTSSLKGSSHQSLHDKATAHDLPGSSEGLTDIRELPSIVDMTSKARRIESWLDQSHQALKNVTESLEEMNEEDDDDDKEDVLDGEFENDDEYYSQ